VPRLLAGLIGSGIQSSLTPAMHEREASAQGMLAMYQIIDLIPLGLDADALPELLSAAQRLGFTGLNITHPCKQSVIALLDELSPDAATLGAVNTVLFRKGRRIGHNTDWWGFAENLRRGLPAAPLGRIVQLGAGGAGGAVAHAAFQSGARQVTLHDTDPARAQATVTRLRSAGHDASVSQDLAAEIAGADGLINTTPVGMAKYPGTPVPTGLLHPRLWVADIIYFPIETELLRTARTLGCRTLDGGGMAVFQAVEAFRLFTGHTPDAERMLAHFAELTSGA
jgi:shikimate dehydrogenase